MWPTLSSLSLTFNIVKTNGKIQRMIVHQLSQSMFNLRLLFETFIILLTCMNPGNIFQGCQIICPYDKVSNARESITKSLTFTRINWTILPMFPRIRQTADFRCQTFLHFLRWHFISEALCCRLWGQHLIAGSFHKTAWEVGYFKSNAESARRQT